ncbi:hypothetical protein [Rhabdochromatium marinum]|uniref:hypothetical protein n=1 Tax=Rhabdochromatium marinum TaxID=48729 RepID=UPI0019045692|nr:hypothetical protein [Rhabdochromatium marinum]MBK1649341.1 hypothetical protein [Rhabdochromatium marinum]
MNFTEVLDVLNDASLFELYRLDAAIRNQLENPARIAAVKQALTQGQRVRYFDDRENRIVEARLLQINRTRVLVQNIADGRNWTLPFYMLDLDGTDVDIAAQSKRGLDKNSVRVGDRVAFRDRQGREQFGEVIKLNTKTAGVMVNNRRWRVAYSLLSPIIEAEAEAYTDPELLSDPRVFDNNHTE